MAPAIRMIDSGGKGLAIKRNKRLCKASRRQRRAPDPFAYVLNAPTSRVDPTGSYIENGISVGAWSSFTRDRAGEPGFEDVRARGPGADTNLGVTRGGGMASGAIPGARVLALPARIIGLIGTPPSPTLPKVIQGIAYDFAVDFGAMVTGLASQLILNPIDSLRELTLALIGGQFRAALDSAWRLVYGTLVPRYGMQNGPYWGTTSTSDEKFDSSLDDAGFWHDLACSGGCSTYADRGWIQIAWRQSRLGPYGQAYRLLGTAGFGLRIAFRMTKSAIASAVAGGG